MRAAGVRRWSDESSIVLQCRADPCKRGAHLGEHSAERSTEPVGNLLKREAALLTELHHFTLCPWERLYRVTDRRPQFSLQQPRVGRVGQCGLPGFQHSRRTAPDELTSQVIAPDICCDTEQIAACVAVQR